MNSPASLLAAQHALLRDVRMASADASLASESELREHLARAHDKATTAMRRAAAAEKREAAAVAEAVQLRAQLAQQGAEAQAAARRAAWEHRKREEAAASTASDRSSAAANESHRLKAELARLEMLLEQRDAEVSALKAQQRALRHKRQEESLQERQAAWLQEREDAGGADAKPKAAAAAGRRVKGPAVATDGRQKRPAAEVREQQAEEAPMDLAPLQSGFILKVLGGGK